MTQGAPERGGGGGQSGLQRPPAWPQGLSGVCNERKHLFNRRKILLINLCPAAPDTAQGSDAGHSVTQMFRVPLARRATAAQSSGDIYIFHSLNYESR